MKRTIGAMVLIAVVFTVCAASADTVFQSYRFQFELPEDWQYKEASDSHVVCVRTVSKGWTETIEVMEPRFGSWPDSFEKMPAYIRKGMGYDNEDAPVIEFEKDGKQIAIIDAAGYNGQDAYMTIMPSSSRKNIAFVLYTADPGHRDMDGFLAMLNTFSERPKDDMGYYSFGNTYVKFAQFEKRTISGKNRIGLLVCWRNLTDSMTTFDTNVDVLIFQNGVELSKSLLTGNDDSEKRVLPGKEMDCELWYDLREADGEITVIIDKKDDINNEYADRVSVFNVH